MGRGEQHDQVGSVITQRLEHLPDGLADGLRRDGML